MRNEQWFRRELEKRLRSRGLLSYMSSMNKPGVPDEHLVVDGRAIWLELKYTARWPKGEDANVLDHRFTGPQLTFMRRLSEAGGLGLGVVGTPRGVLTLPVDQIAADGTVARRRVQEHLLLELDDLFADRFLTLVSRL